MNTVIENINETVIEANRNLKLEMGTAKIILRSYYACSFIRVNAYN